MIKIGSPYLKAAGSRTRLCADIDRDGAKKTLWFEVDNQFAKYLLVERSDAFVVGLLQYAMRNGHDIVSDAPMTRRMYEQLTEQFLPMYYKINRIGSAGVPGYPTKVTASTAPEALHDGLRGVGTGVSCGVDSMHVFAAHPEITHACLWNMHGVTNDETPEKRMKGWENSVDLARKYTDYIGCELIICGTNYDRGCFEDMYFDGSTTYGNLFGILALEKLWSKYYVASGYDIADFSLTLGVNADPAHYEYVLFPFLSTDNMSLRMDGVAQTRIEKVGDLVNYEPSYKFLNVCWEINEDGKNCSNGCPKCMRTMLNIDAYGALDKYRDVFDVDYYRNHFEDYLAELYRGYIQKNSFALEQRPYFVDRPIPFLIRLKAWRIVFKKALLKLLRFGKVSNRFVSH